MRIIEKKKSKIIVKTNYNQDMYPSETVIVYFGHFLII